MRNSYFTTFLCLASSFTSSIVFGAGPQVSVVTNAQPQSLERIAAEEVAGCLKRLYQAEVKVETQPNNQSTHVIFVGTPETNAQMKAWAGDWPKMTDQGHCLKSVTFRDRPALLIGGGSPVATYWAAAEFEHKLGVRSLLYGDLDPISPPPFDLSNLNIVMEPALKTRTWRTVNDFPIGPESWGLPEQKQVLRQLAKQKYNRILISVYPWHPFVDYEFRGVKKETGFLWFGWKYPVSGNTAGRSVFSGAKFFDNPEFVGANTYDERVTAGKRFLQGIIDSSHELGMTVGLVTSPLEFPKEFGKALPGSKIMRGLEELTISPGAAQKPDDPLLMELTKTQLRAYIDTYPNLDAIYLTLPEFPEWSEHADLAWNRLSQQAGTGQLPKLGTLIESARNRPLIASSARGEQALRGNLVAIDFLNRLRSNETFFRRPDGRSLEVNYVHIDPALFSSLERIIPKQTGVLHFVDYTARRVLQNKQLLESVPTKSIPSHLILTLADDNVGLLPQTVHSSLEGLMSELNHGSWSGFSTRYWCVGDLDLSSYFLSRASCDPQTTAKQALRDMVKSTCGEDLVAPIEKGLNLIEQATTTIDENDIGFSFPVPGVVMRHYGVDGEPPEWWGQARDHYLNAMNEFYRANTRARAGGRSFTLYLARRAEFGFEYMNCVEAVRKAGMASRRKDVEEQKKQLQAAVDSMYSGLNALAAVTRSNSDRGIIAVLNEYGYRPLVKELEEAENASDSK